MITPRQETEARIHESHYILQLKVNTRWSKHSQAVTWTHPRPARNRHKIKRQQFSRGFCPLSLEENNGLILHLMPCLHSRSHHALLPRSQLCARYDQNTPLTMSRAKWEEMSAVSAYLQHDDAVISRAQGELMFVSSGGMSQTGLWTVVGVK